MAAIWLFTLSYFSGTYELILLLLAFREYFTWKLAGTWLSSLIIFILIAQQLTALFPQVPLVFFWIIPLLAITTWMSSRLLAVNWLLMLPLAIFLNAIKRLIGALLGSLVKFMMHSASPMSLRQVLNLYRVADLNLFWAVVLGLPVIIILGLIAHHWVVKVSAVDFLQHAMVERSDYLLVGLSVGTYILGYSFAMETSIIAQTYTAIIASVFFGTIGIYLVLNKNSRLNDQQLITSVTKYNQLLSHRNQDLHLFKHDYQNILLSLSSYIESGDLEGLKQYFKTEIKPTDTNLTDNIALASLRFLEVPELSGLLFAKYETAREHGVNVNFYIQKLVKLTNYPKVRAIRILGNLLDNAIDAAQQTNQQVIVVIDTPSTQVINFKIQNTIPAGTDLDLNQLSKMHVTTKPGHLGYGLSSIQQLTTKEVYVNYQVKDHQFTATLTINASSH